MERPRDPASRVDTRPAMVIVRFRCHGLSQPGRPETAGEPAAKIVSWTRTALTGDLPLRIVWGGSSHGPTRVLVANSGAFSHPSSSVPPIDPAAISHSSVSCASYPAALRPRFTHVAILANTSQLRDSPPTTPPLVLTSGCTWDSFLLRPTLPYFQTAALRERPSRIHISRRRAEQVPPPRHAAITDDAADPIHPRFAAS